MKSKPSSDPSARARAGASSPANVGHAPTVPISVYRELAAELQATKAMLDSLNTQNQQVVRQNHLLRQEIERLIQSALNLQQISASYQPGTPPAELARLNADAVADQLRPSRPARRPRPAESPNAQPNPALPNQPAIAPDFLSNDLFTEQDGTHRLSRDAHKPSRDLSTIWLWLVVLAIIVTAFGAGFMMVKPLLPKR